MEYGCVVSEKYANIPGRGVIKTLQSQDPLDLADFIEYSITGGLGYAPVRKQTEESKVHTQKGLETHLANMDKCVEMNERLGQYLMSAEDLSRKIKDEEEYIARLSQKNTEEGIAQIHEDVAEMNRAPSYEDYLSGTFKRLVESLSESTKNAVRIVRQIAQEEIDSTKYIFRPFEKNKRISG